MVLRSAILGVIAALAVASASMAAPRAHAPAGGAHGGGPPAAATHGHADQHGQGQGHGQGGAPPAAPQSAPAPAPAHGAPAQPAPQTSYTPRSHGGHGSGNGHGHGPAPHSAPARSAPAPHAAPAPGHGRGSPHGAPAAAQGHGHGHGHGAPAATAPQRQATMQTTAGRAHGSAGHGHTAPGHGHGAPHVRPSLHGSPHRAPAQAPTRAPAPVSAPVTTSTASHTSTGHGRPGPGRAPQPTTGTAGHGHGSGHPGAPRKPASKGAPHAPQPVAAPVPQVGLPVALRELATPHVQTLHPQRRGPRGGGLQSLVGPGHRSLLDASGGRATAAGALARSAALSRTGALPLGTLTTVNPTPGPQPRKRHATAPRQHASGGDHGRADSGSSGPLHTVLVPFEHIVRVIPGWLWLTIAGLGGLAMAATGVAILTTNRSRQAQAAAAQAERVATTDPLTGLLNRRGLCDGLAAELARAERYDRRVAVAYLDVRGLKRVNDSRGHAAGDTLLRAVADLLRDGSRDGDLCARVGGDEYAVVLSEQGQPGARAFTERLARQLPAARERAAVGETWDVTVGVAVFPEDGDTADELLHAADERLYAQRGIAVGR